MHSQKNRRSDLHSQKSNYFEQHRHPPLEKEEDIHEESQDNIEIQKDVAEEIHQPKGKMHEHVTTESNQMMYFHTDPYTGASVFEVKIEKETPKVYITHSIIPS